MNKFKLNPILTDIAPTEHGVWIVHVDRKSVAVVRHVDDSLVQFGGHHLRFLRIDTMYVYDMNLENF